MSEEDQAVFTSSQVAERWDMEKATLAVWRMRDKKRMKKGLAPLGPAWTEIGRGLKPRIRYMREDIERYEQANKRAAVPATEAGILQRAQGRRGTKRKGVLVKGKR